MIDYIFIGFEYLKKCANYLIDKVGYKLVKKDNYIEENDEVDFNYVEKSEKCQDEKSKGSVFQWDYKHPYGYEKYFEIIDDKKIFYTHKNLVLWIKRNIKKGVV